MSSHVWPRDKSRLSTRLGWDRITLQINDLADFFLAPVASNVVDFIVVCVLSGVRHMEGAEDQQLVAAPTLVKKLPLPLRKLVGDMHDSARVLIMLGVKAKAEE